jgi:hypothetical protein
MQFVTSGGVGGEEGRFLRIPVVLTPPQFPMHVIMSNMFNYKRMRHMDAAVNQERPSSSFPYHSLNFSTLCSYF